MVFVIAGGFFLDDGSFEMIEFPVATLSIGLSCDAFVYFDTLSRWLFYFG